jgi:2-amino-4-hydroxy-6-hydroxymethyldihydropteridine diphosphokinase
MRDAVIVYIGLGANLGDAAQAVREALLRIAALPQTRLMRQSSLYCTAPIDAAGPDYVNAVAEVATHLNAPELLAQLQQLELQAGRRRSYRNAPRTLDLDLLFFGDGRIESAALTVPHPRMRERAFVLVPLAEIEPQRVRSDWLVAVAGQNLTRLPPP